MMLKKLYLSLLILLLGSAPRVMLAQLTPTQEATVKQTAQRYTELLQRLGRDHNDSDAFEELVSQVFVSGARVYDDFLEGEVMDEHMVYLGKVREYRGQLQLQFSNYRYRYKRQHGMNFGIVQVTKGVQMPRFNYTVTNYLAINADNGKLTEITKSLPPNTFAFGESEIIIAPEAISVANNTTILTNNNTTTTKQSGDIIKDLPWLEMVYVEGGTFKMGYDPDKDGEDKNIDNAKPLHEVQLDDFCIGKYEVTVDQFKRFVEATNYLTDAEKGEGSSTVSRFSLKYRTKDYINWRYNVRGTKRPSWKYQHPVIHVSWNDAKAFCDWISKETGHNYRLPTEA